MGPPQSNTLRTTEEQKVVERQFVMKLCAQAEHHELAAVLEKVGFSGFVQDIRPPEAGLVMTRGRIGGDGNPFNLGEATVIRAVMRIESGETGFSYHLGRDAEKARLAAILDALCQSVKYGHLIRPAMEPIAERLAGEHRQYRRQIAATKVNFFTMVRGEDA